MQSYKILLAVIFIGFNFIVPRTSFSSEGINLPGEFSGSLSFEKVYYPVKGLYGNDKKFESSLLLSPEYSFSWNDDRQLLSFMPFAIVSTLDHHKNHYDIREASYVAAFEKSELRVGISKVFWGVTESQHLVDIINQTDLVIGPTGEEKFGQPMLNLTLFSDFGNLDLFVLPYFRERTFSGKNGRFRSALIIDTDAPLYEHPKKEKHIDLATRYSHSISNLDLGFSLFKGTDRAPLFILAPDSTTLRPFYAQATQVGIDLQYIYQAWILKWEGIYKDLDATTDYASSTMGFEYNFSNIKSSGVDLGLLIEYLYDDRPLLLTPFYNHTFLAFRLTLNDEESTELLSGVFINNDIAALESFQVEASRRISDSLKSLLEINVVVNNNTNNFLHSLRNDDYIKFSLNYYY